MARVSRLFVSCDYAQMNIQNLTNLVHLRNYHFHSQNTVTKLAIMEVLELLLSNISEAVSVSKCSGLFSFNSYIRGFHAYKQNWDPVLGRRYSCTTEEKNEHDEYAVAVVNDDEVVGHISLSLSKIMSVFKIDWFTHGSRSDWKVRQPRSRLQIRNTM